MSESTVVTGPTTVAPAGAQRSQSLRVWFSAFLGGSIEFYDFSIYSTAAALVFAPLFFTGAPPTIGLIASFATLAVGYIARPLGGIIFGHFGDKIGRKSSLIVTVVIMALATALIGVLPTFEQVGAIAPILLILLRIVQGLSVGGEWGGSVVLTTEHSKVKRRSLMGVATPMGSAFGLLLGFIAFAIVIPASGDQFMVWGWRIPFLSTIVLFAVALYMRFRVSESDVMKEQRLKIAADTKAGIKFKKPFVEVFKKHWRTIIISALVFAGPFLIQSLMLSFYVSYTVGTMKIPNTEMVNISMIGLTVTLLALPVVAWISDRVGRRRVMTIGVILATINAIFIWPLLSTGMVWGILLTYVLVFLIHAIVLAPLAATYSELYPTKMRYTGVSMSYQVASLLAGGLGPVLAQSFIAAGWGPWSVSGLLVFSGLVAIWAVFRLKKTDNVDLRTVGTPAQSMSGEANPAPIAIG
ncbi:MAG: transporter [Subtercola sp.]|nr:transporter [Subtercola sp.]